MYANIFFYQLNFFNVFTIRSHVWRMVWVAWFSEKWKKEKEIYIDGITLHDISIVVAWVSAIISAWRAKYQQGSSSWIFKRPYNAEIYHIIYRILKHIYLCCNFSKLFEIYNSKEKSKTLRWGEWKETNISVFL